MDEISPRQAEFMRNYINPKSETFGNGYASAIKAGYSEHYAHVITTRDYKWLKEAELRRVKLVDKAENNLEALLDSEDEKVKADMTKFALKTLKKDIYSERTEMTGKDGQPVLVMPSELIKKYDELPSGTEHDSE